jgi:hypothetical protein
MRTWPEIEEMLTIVEDQPWVFSVPFARRGRKAHP